MPGYGKFQGMISKSSRYIPLAACRGVTGIAALNRRPAFLTLLLSSNMAYPSPFNGAPPSRPVPQDRSSGGAVVALVGRVAPARTGFG